MNSPFLPKIVQVRFLSLVKKEPDQSVSIPTEQLHKSLLGKGNYFAAIT